MRPRGAILSVALCAWLTGCGASHTSASQSTSTSASASSTAAVTAAPGSTGILARVLTHSELKGFAGSPDGIDASAGSWLAGEQGPGLTAEHARLTRLGFIRGVREDLSAGATPGLSEVEQFHSAKAASAELAAEVAEYKAGAAGPYKAFAVPGIPAAHGYTLIQGSQGGVNIAFAKGPYYYLVGQELAPSQSIKAAIATVTAAAQHLYHRVSA